MSCLRVSVIIPCYNHGKYLRQAVNSVLMQTNDFIEVVVIDDGSVDDTPAVAAEFGAMIVYVRQENAGLSAARNAGVEHSRGEYLIFLDADDYLDDGVIEAHVAAATAKPDISVFVCGWRVVDASDVEVARIEAPTISDDFASILLRKNFIPVHSIMVHRRCFNGHVPFDVRLRSHEDWDCWLSLLSMGASFGTTGGCYAVLRQLPGSMSSNLLRMYDTALCVLNKHRAMRLHCDDCLAGWIAGRYFHSRKVVYDYLHLELGRGHFMHAAKVVAAIARRCLSNRVLLAICCSYVIRRNCERLRRAIIRMPLLWRLVR